MYDDDTRESLDTDTRESIDTPDVVPLALFVPADETAEYPRVFYVPIQPGMWWRE